MTESVTWIQDVWLHRMQLALYWSLLLPIVWGAMACCSSLSPRLRSWILRVVYLKLLVVLVVPTLWALPVWKAHSPQQAADIELLPFSAAELSVGQASGEPQGARWSAVQMLALLWFVGVFVLIARYLSGWRRVNRLVLAANELSENAPQFALIQQLRRIMGVDVPVKIRVSPHLHMPCVFGCVRPTILLPEKFCDECDPSEQKLILAHELAHISRCDLAWNMMHTAVNVALFFHPFIWLLQREWRLSQEMACDEIALTTTHASPFSYGALILRLSGTSSVPALPPVVVGASEFPIVRRRLLMLRTTTSKRSKQTMVGSVALACVSIAFLAPWQLARAEKEPTEPIGAAPEYLERTATWLNSTLTALLSRMRE